MPVISFDREYVLLIALALLLFAMGLAIVDSRRRRARIERLAAGPMVLRLLPDTAVRPRHWRTARLALAAALLGVAAAGPRWGEENVLVSGEGVDLVLILDGSLSMLARDVQPSRLESMKQEVRRLLALSPNDRVALLAFAGRSYILTPITVDHGALDLFVDEFDPSIVGVRGTSLSSALRQATSLLQATRTVSDRAIVVMTDGEAHESLDDILQAARQIREARISLVLVGFGTTRGTTIPVKDGDRELLHRDENGNIVLTQYRPEVLRAAGNAAGGTFVEAEATEKPARIRQALSRLRTERRAEAARANLKPRFQLLLWPALILLLLDTWLAVRVTDRRLTPNAAPSA